MQRPIRFLAGIPLFNKQRTIRRAIKSVLSQNHTHFNLLIVDDGSSDGSLDEIGDLLEDDRLTLIQQENKGVSHARNRLIDATMEGGYDYLALLDADDYWAADHLKILTELGLRFPQAGLLCTNHRSQLKPSYSILIKSPSLVQPFFTHMHGKNYPTASSVAISRSGMDKIGSFDEEVTHGEDTDYWIRAGLLGKVAYHPKVTVNIDKQDKGGSNRIPFIERRYPDLDVYEQHIHSHLGLKKYLDQNRFAIALEAKLAGEISTYKNLKSRISRNSLSRKRNILISTPRWVLRHLSNFTR